MGRTRRDITTGAAQDAVLEEAFTFVGDRMGITAEAEVREGVMLTNPTPPPTKTDRECRVAVRTVGTEVVRSRKNGLIRGVGK